VLACAFCGGGTSPAIKTFRHRLEATEKPVKIPITAGARTFLTILNAMFRDNADYRPT